MPTNLSIKNAPDEIVARLKRRAAEHHRSLQGELLSILEEAVSSSSPLTATDVLAEVKRLGLHTPAEAAEMVRGTAMAVMVDASALAALLFGEPEGENVGASSRRRSSCGAGLASL